MKRHSVGRIYFGFALAVVTIAFPPLMIFTIPAFVMMLRAGRRARREAYGIAYMKAAEKYDRAMIAAMKGMP